MFCGVPRLYNRFYDAIQANISTLTGAKKKLVDNAIAVKLENLRNHK